MEDETFSAPQGARAEAVERVRKLLAKASDPAATEAEAEAFEAKAMEIMARHEIAERELREASPVQAQWVEVRDWGNSTYGVVTLWHRLAALHGVYSLWYSGTKRVRLFGTAAQLEDVERLCTHLLPQLRRDVNRDKPQSRKSYATAWAVTAAKRIDDARARVYAEAGTALVPTTAKAEEYATGELGIKAGPSREFDLDYNSTMKGVQAGAQAHLGQREVAS